MLKKQAIFKKQKKITICITVVIVFIASYRKDYRLQCADTNSRSTIELKV